ncbi:MAG: hypothetical protein E4H02_00090 [Lentisphaerales bacterium]|jgi:hypothetical protein|nr:MAG: hypothetical protein E4H02_00090 [Lentisphaerales bacterium]
MRLLWNRACAAVVVLALLSVLVLGACERSLDTSELQGYFDENEYESLSRPDLDRVSLTVSPSGKTMTYDGQQAKLSAGGGIAPYSWDVHDVSLGSIIEDSGAVVIYRRETLGDNVVILTDSTGDQSFCVIAQPAEETTE